MKKIVIGSRQSELAMTQTRWVIDRLQKLAPDYEFEVKKIVTKGDRILDVTLSKVGGKGLFVKEIEQAMLDGEIDMAVHSMKDMPAELPDGLVIGSVPERVDPRDVLISKTGATLDQLPEGAIIGTSSLRRGAQMKAYRPDFQIKPVRGNVGTRLRKLEEEDYDAIILAAAGMERLNWDEKVITQYLPVEISLPAVGQGALAVECREDDHTLLELLAQLNHPLTQLTVEAERAFLHTLEGGCQVPIGAYATLSGDPTGDYQIHLTGFVASPDGSELLKESMTGREPGKLGKDLAASLAEKGAEHILERFREEQNQ
ncbi:MAG: hydroxymethylbilane synthase [Bacillaceae bacterium]|nr:hydroxymethylbilane synthase [Bacillaceae bacterium]